MEQIKNPVLPGFNADPSIIRVDDTYYIANSTFEWFPGVRLHESKDMVHWKLLPSALSTTTLLSPIFPLNLPTGRSQSCLFSSSRAPFNGSDLCYKVLISHSDVFRRT